MRVALHPALLLPIALTASAAVAVLFIEGMLPLQADGIELLRERHWVTWLAHSGIVLGIAVAWWALSGHGWGGVIFGNGLNVGHEIGQKLYGSSSWANLDTFMDLALPLALSILFVGAILERGRTPTDASVSEGI